MAKRPSGRYELRESLDRFSRFDEAFTGTCCNAASLLPDDGAAQMIVHAPGIDLARRQITVRSRARGMKSHDIADELGRMGAA